MLKKMTSPLPPIKKETQLMSCPLHGDYESTRYLLEGSKSSPWSRCPICEQDEHRKQVEADLAEAARRKLEDALELDACIPRRFLSRTLDNFRSDTDEQKRLLAVATEYVQSWPTRFRAGSSLLITGPAGTGKTHILAGIAQAVMRKFNATVVYTSASKILMDVKATYGRDSKAREKDVIAGYLQPDLLCIDEFGRTFGTDAERTILFNVIDHRYEAMRPVAIASNLLADGIVKQFGDAFLSRMLEGGTLHQITGANVRYDSMQYTEQPADPPPDPKREVLRPAPPKPVTPPLKGRPKQKIPDYRVPPGPGSYFERRAQVSPFAYEKLYGTQPPSDWPGWKSTKTEAKQ